MDHSVLAAMPAFQGPTWGRATGLSKFGLSRSGPANSGQSNAEALTCIGLAAEYNFRRLTTYRERERHGDSMRIRATESAAFFRFDKLGYFNSVYTCDETIVDRLSEVEEFYADCPFPRTLVGPPLKQPARYAEACLRRNWHPHGGYAWMHRALSGMSAMPEAFAFGPFDIRSPHPDERELFLHCYLESFASPPEGRADAVRNMRHLFEWPDLHCLFAFLDGEPLGIAMLLQIDDAALYCTGGGAANRPGELLRHRHT